MYPNDYARQLKDEIWGVFKHMGIPISTIYSMPVHERRYYIMKHNEEQEGLKKQMSNNNNGGMNTIMGDLNEYAKMEQANAKVRGGKF